MQITRKSRYILLGSAVFLCLSLVIFYFNKEFIYLNDPIDAITISFEDNTYLNKPIIYINDSTESQIEFTQFFSTESITDDSFIIKFNRGKRLRQFRLYFPDSLGSIIINRISAVSRDCDYIFKNEEFNITDLKFNSNSFKKLELKSEDLNGYIESKKIYYFSDLLFILISIISFVVISYLLLLNLYKLEYDHLFKSLSFSDWTVVMFIFSLFLNQKYINISLVISSLVLIRNFRYRNLLSLKINWFLIGYFVLLAMSLFFWSDGVINLKYFERNFLFFVLPIYFSLIEDKNYLGFFPFFSVTVGLVFLGISLVKIFIFRNIDIASFDNFATEPIYFSYLIAFAIIYSGLHYKPSSSKDIIQLFLILVLVLSGSKIIIFIVGVILLILSKRRVMSVLTLISLIVFLAFFPPTQKRFRSIFRIDDFSIVMEKYISNPDDVRLNGITFRIILWQESIKSLHNLSYFIFGRGVSEKSQHELKNRLLQRGLYRHSLFNSHNQYVSTLYSLGLSGLLVLFGLLVYLNGWARVHKQDIMQYFIFLMSVAMLSESIFLRSIGIAIFLSIILFMVKSFQHLSLKLGNSLI